MKIKWKGFQKRCIRWGLKRNYGALLLDPGLGKTSILLQIMKIKIFSGKARGALVVAPLRPAYMTWPAEMEKWEQFHNLTYTILHSEWGNKDKELEKDYDIYIINPEGLKWLYAKLYKINPMKWPFNFLGIDESTKFKSMDRKNKRGKFLRKLARGFKYRFILTGTPVANSYRNIQGQWALMDLGKAFGIKKGEFLRSYFRQIGRPEWDQWEIQEECRERFERHVAKSSIRLSARDYIKMPKIIMNPIKIKMDKTAFAYYKRMEKQMIIEIKNKGTVIALSKGSAHQKCWQIANGAIYQQDAKQLQPNIKRKNNDYWIIHEQKLDAVQDLLDELNGKPLLTAYNFKHDLAQLKKRFKGLIVLEGSMKRCREIETQWNKGNIEHLAAYPGTTALGLNLQQVCTDICFYSLIYDYESFDQFIQRVARQGNTSKFVMVHILMMISTVDEKTIWPTLEEKGYDQAVFLKNVEKYIVSP